MAYTLISRNKFIPGGFFFYIPQTKFMTRKGSFSSAVDQVIAHRQANAWLNQSTDRTDVEAEVDAFCAKYCAAQGWTEYVFMQGGGMPPKPKAPSAADLKQLAAVGGAVKKIWAGVRTINDWIDSKEDPVAQEQAEKRAAVCAGCPKNGQGDMTKWFTRPAAEVIKRQIEKLADRKLVTEQSDKLNICECCLCPMKLKVFTPMKFITPHMSAEVLAELKTAPNCWIVSELAS